ncbi:MAG: DUF134 domain-containing protein [Clostridia bacterium]
MPRPRKWRKVCCLPESTTFGPMDSDNRAEGSVVMTIDEYETIRLIDYEGMTQEECSTNMNVARTTVQRIYNDARRKISESIVEGKIISIEGGDYTLYSESEQMYGRGCCRRHRFGLQDDPEDI